MGCGFRGVRVWGLGKPEMMISGAGWAASPLRTQKDTRYVVFLSTQPSPTVRTSVPSVWFHSPC